MIGEPFQAIKSSLDWWADAGLVDAVSDQPCNWLAPAERAIPLASVAIERPAAPPVSSSPVAQPVDAVLPDTLPQFDAWLADSPALPGTDWSMRRLLPTGPADSPLMLLSDVPDPADIEAERLFSGKQGQLLDAMLAAVGMARDVCRVGSIALTRPVGGRIDEAASQALTAITRHHIALARPKALLLLGQQSAQLVAEETIAPVPRQRLFNHNGVTVALFAIHHPRLLLERPLLKRPAWEVLKRVREQF